MDDVTMEKIGRLLDGISKELYRRAKPCGVEGIGSIEHRDLLGKVEIIQKIMESMWEFEIEELTRKYEVRNLKKRLEDMEDQMFWYEWGYKAVKPKKKKNGNKYAYKDEVNPKLVAELWQNHVSISKIAEKLNVSRGTIYSRLQEMGLYEKKSSQSSQNSDGDLVL